MLDQPARAPRGQRIAIVVKGYPRLSETFIAHEIEALERRGFVIEIWSLRHPTDRHRHPVHGRIAAQLHYLPEYLYREPIRVLRGAAWSIRHARVGVAIQAFLRDLARDPTPNRVRRLGQALVLARELEPQVDHLHVHYLHTPCSVVRYAGLLLGRAFTISAHAKDIWTTPEWELREKLLAARFTVVCTEEGARTLREAAPRARIKRVYHGLDPQRAPPPSAPLRSRDGADPGDPVRIVTVGRAVPKKGFEDLLDALAAVPRSLHWRLVHIGGGALIRQLRQRAERLGIAESIIWRGSQPEAEVFRAMREGDLFVLAARMGPKGDRDGLPNVLLEAASQELALVATSFSAIPEFIRDRQEGILVPPGSVERLSEVVSTLIADPDQRARLGRAARLRLWDAFDFDRGVDEIAGLLDAAMHCEVVSVP